MRGETLAITVKANFFIESCVECGVMFAMTEEFKAEKLRHKTSFYCPSGHSQRYIGKTDSQLRREAEQRADEAEAKAQAAATALKRAKSEFAKRDALAARVRAASARSCSSPGI
jgi:hypothetical protein